MTVFRDDQVKREERLWMTSFSLLDPTQGGGEDRQGEVMMQMTLYGTEIFVAVQYTTLSVGLTPSVIRHF